jgi:hypothetical protein
MFKTDVRTILSSLKELIILMRQLLSGDTIIATESRRETCENELEVSGLISLENLKNLLFSIAIPISIGMK